MEAVMSCVCVCRIRNVLFVNLESDAFAAVHIYTIIIVGKLHVAILARSSREMSQTVCID